MRTLAIALLSIATSTEAALPGALRPGISSEIRVALRRSGYEKLCATLPLIASDQRRDSYFDYYDSGRFLLTRRDQPYKVRIKQTAATAETQVSQRVSREAIKSAGLTAAATVVHAYEGKLSGTLAKRLLPALDDFFAALHGMGPIEALAGAAGELMDGHAFSGRREVRQAVASAPAARLLPAARNDKVRRRVSLVLENGERLEAVLGATQAVDQHGAPITLYELEADVSESDPARLRLKARQLLNALRRLGLTAPDLSGPAPDAFAFTERRLAQRLYKVIKDGRVVLSPVPGRFAGWRKGRIFGRLDCWSGKRMSKENRVFFLTWEDAIAAGYRPCKHCRPARIQ